MKRLASTVATIAFAVLAAPPVWAADMKDMSGMKEGGTKAGGMKGPDGQRHKGRGTVKKVDAKAGKVTLAHEPIRSLGFPAMSMDFRLKDRATLDTLKPGAKVEFELVKGSGDEYEITKITLPKP